MTDDSTTTERRLSAVETQLHDNITTRAEQEQEFARLLIERMSEVLNDFRAGLLREVDERARADALRHNELQRQIDTRFDNFGGEIDVIRDTHQLTQGIGNDTQQLVQEVNTLKTGQTVLSSEFHEFVSAIGERVTNNEARIDAVEAGLKESKQDRADLRQQNTTAQQERKRIEDKVDTLTTDFHTFRDEIRALIASARPPEEVERLVELIERHERELAAKRAEAGDGE